MSERYYVATPLGLGPLTLDGPEAHHLATVCRLRPGDAVCLFNGDGHEYEARVSATAKRRVELEVTERRSPQRELPFLLRVAAPVPKGDRAQFLVEKLTELGVTHFVPLRTRRSVVHPRETKIDRFERHVIEASKQCGRNVLLRVEPLSDWEAFCRRADLGGLRVVAHPGEPTTGGAGSTADAVTVAVGPEGGFTDEEIQEARRAGWRTLDLGPRILRVETAALALAAWSVAALARPTAAELLGQSINPSGDRQ
jgi:16S rRNA (uracil1498-N3)-methyltransferase